MSTALPSMSSTLTIKPNLVPRLPSTPLPSPSPSPLTPQYSGLPPPSLSLSELRGKIVIPNVPLKAGESEKFRLRRMRILRYEQEQALEDAEDLKRIQQGGGSLLYTVFQSVKTEFSDLDGLSWDDPRARELLERWTQEHQRKDLEASPLPPLTRQTGSRMYRDVDTDTEVKAHSGHRYEDATIRFPKRSSSSNPINQGTQGRHRRSVRDAINTFAVPTMNSEELHSHKRKRSIGDTAALTAQVNQPEEDDGGLPAMCRPGRSAMTVRHSSIPVRYHLEGPDSGDNIQGVGRTATVVGTSRKRPSGPRSSSVGAF